MEAPLRERKYGEEFPDVDVARCLREGFPLVGDMPTTGVFRKKPEHEVEYGADPEWLEHMAPELREELIESMARGEVSELGQDIYDITCGDPDGGSEVTKGWAEGPYTEEEVTKIIGYDRWVAARRLSVRQGKKIRQIDDFSRFFVNGCTTVDEHIDLDGVDQFLNLSKTWIDFIEQAKREKGWLQATWGNERTSWHLCHEDFTNKPTQLQ